MITGAHFLLSSRAPDVDRAFIRDILGFRSVDAGEGWLIFALPRAELAVHPSRANFVQVHAGQEIFGAVFYLMCNNLPATIKSLNARNVQCGPISEASWGRSTSIRLSSGSDIGLYQPTHPTALDLPPSSG